MLQGCGLVLTGMSLPGVSLASKIGSNSPSGILQNYMDGSDRSILIKTNKEGLIQYNY